MNILVKYIDFHSNNHQGGEGQSFEFQVVVEVPADIKASDVKPYIERAIGESAKAKRPFHIKYDPDPTIIKMEIL